MKIRKGFVSNSSSSSFICDVSGEEQCGMDLCLSDIDWYQCGTGGYHTFADSSYLIQDVVKEEIIKSLKENSCSAETEWLAYLADKKDGEIINLSTALKNISGWSSNYVPECFCPFCMNMQVTDETIYRDLIKKSGKTMDQLKKEYLENINK